MSKSIYKQEKRGGILRSEYDKVHKWLHYHFGEANKCENPNCLGKSKNFAWAKRPNCKYERKRENYQMLCYPCHTRQDMTDDTKRKMSIAKAGEKAPKAKLTEIEVLEIRQLSAEGNTSFELAERYGVTDRNINHVVSRDSWKHI